MVPTYSQESPIEAALCKMNYMLEVNCTSNENKKYLLRGSHFLLVLKPFVMLQEEQIQLNKFKSRSNILEEALSDEL